MQQKKLAGRSFFSKLGLAGPGAHKLKPQREFEGRTASVGKKIHTLVKENTPCCHKVRPVSLCFLPHCHANIGRQVRLITPNTYQEIYDTHTCLNFWKTCQNVCLWKTCLKAIVNSLRFWGSTHSKNKLAGRSFFQNLGSQGPGRVSPGGSSRLQGGFNCVSKVLLKSQCKNMAFGRGKSNHTLARCAFFYQHCFTNIIET